MSKIARTAAYFAAACAAVLLIRWLQSRPTDVEVIKPATRTITETIAASGEVRGRIETNVGAQIGGRLTAVLVREGDTVYAGQIIARLEDAVLRAQVEQAREASDTAKIALQQGNDAIITAHARLQQTARKPLASDIARTKADTSQAVEVANAKLTAARQHLAELIRGATAEQREQTIAQTENAAVTLAKAERDLERRQKLYADGAIARADLDTYETARDNAQKSLDNLKAHQKEIEVGTRTEQIAQARADLVSAQATLAGTQASGKAQVRSILSLPRREDVVVAQAQLTEAQRARNAASARLAEAQSALATARQQLDESRVAAPFDGTVTQIITEVGGVTGAGQPIVKLARTARTEVRVSIDEDYLGKIRVGQKAFVTADAFPGQKVDARVREISPRVDTASGTVEVRLDPLNKPIWLHNGQTLTVNLIVDEGTPRLVVPLGAVTTVGGQSSLFVAENGFAKKRFITVGATGDNGIPIPDGLRSDELVILNPRNVEDGRKVQPHLKATDKTTTAAR